MSSKRNTFSQNAYERFSISFTNKKCKQRLAYLKIINTTVVGMHAVKKDIHSLLIGMLTGSSFLENNMHIF